jgi:fermentation-respiration switch protein FrsA (DUF1100 family)
LVRDRFDSGAKIAQIGVPLFVVHGERDQTIPVQFGKALFAAAVEPKEAIWLPDAGHNDIARFGSDAAVLDFLKRNRLAPSSG